MRVYGARGVGEEPFHSPSISAFARFARSWVRLACDPGVSLRFTPGFMLSPASRVLTFHC
jgi:hypothetical protein